MEDVIWDCVIVGAGASGCAAARELSRTDGRYLVLEAADDVGCGTSKANSAIVHAGFDAHPGTLMARLNVEGNALFPGLAQELDFAFMPVGSLVVCTCEDRRPALEALLERGRSNGVPGLRVVEKDELRRMEPNVSDAATCALWAPTAGICDPFGLVIALFENARQNGVDFSFGSRVESVEREGGLWLVHAGGGVVRSRCVVNAAGVYADQIHNMVSPHRMVIAPRRGEYELLDTSAGSHVRHTVFTLPTKMGKGVLVTPTVHGNLLVGPTADDVDDREGTQTTAAGLGAVRCRSALGVRDIPFREVIASFSGLRAHRPEHDFAIGELPEAPGFVDCAGIESPGLTACPAIGRMVASEVLRALARMGRARGPRPDFQPRRRGYVNLNCISPEEWNELIARDPSYGNIVCRCCLVSEGQIREACRRGARSVDAVKRRTGATMGRCQGGFCCPRIMQIISQEHPDIPFAMVTKKGGASRYLAGNTKEVAPHG